MVHRTGVVLGATRLEHPTSWAGITILHHGADIRSTRPVRPSTVLRRDDDQTLELSWEQGERRAVIRFSGPRFRYRDRSDPLHADDDIVEHTVHLEGNGLDASAVLVSLDTAGHGLARFLDGLADDFRGWDGTRTWRNADRDLSVGATWSSRGHVSLDWHLIPSLYDRWSAHVVVDVEAGEEMVRLAAGLRRFFASAV